MSDKIDWTTIKASRVDTADFIENSPSGVTVQYSAVYKFSNIVFGSIIFKLASGTFRNAQTLIGYIKPSCRPMTTLNAYCSLSNDIWSSTNIEYDYVANNGTVYIAGHGTTGLNVAKVQFMWATN